MEQPSKPAVQMENTDAQKRKTVPALQIQESGTDVHRAIWFSVKHLHFQLHADQNPAAMLVC